MPIAITAATLGIVLLTSALILTFRSVERPAVKRAYESAQDLVRIADLRAAFERDVAAARGYLLTQDEGLPAGRDDARRAPETSGSNARRAR